MNEEKKYALVTGASSGIGLAMSRELARRGYPLLLVSNEEEKLVESAADTGKTFNVQTVPLYMDLAQRDSAGKIFDYMKENNIEAEILVNNAGIFFFRDVANTTSERIETVINLHILTPTLLSRFFVQQAKGGGHILNMASIAAWMMMPGLTFYNATKSYLRCFSRAMRNEAYKQDINITTVCPGAVATGLYGLAPRYMKLGMRLGIILSPERLAVKALNRMFRKKAEYIPGGFLNRFFIGIVISLPEWLIRRIKKKIDVRLSQK